MTMHRRPLGGARRLAGLSSILLIVACLLPWFGTSSESGLPPLSGNAFSGSGIVVFFVALAVIALLALPYAAGDTPVSLDRPLSFLILAIDRLGRLRDPGDQPRDDEHRGPLPDARLRPLARGDRADPPESGRLRHAARAAGLAVRPRPAPAPVSGSTG